MANAIDAQIEAAYCVAVKIALNATIRFTLNPQEIAKNAHLNVKNVMIMVNVFIVSHSTP